jgi:hypothetical protein
MRGGCSLLACDADPNDCRFRSLQAAERAGETWNAFTYGGLLALAALLMGCSFLYRVDKAPRVDRWGFTCHTYAMWAAIKPAQASHDADLDERIAAAQAEMRLASSGEQAALGQQQPAQLPPVDEEEDPGEGEDCDAEQEGEAEQEDAADELEGVEAFDAAGDEQPTPPPRWPPL